MKVSEVIKALTKNYNPDDELFITWWDKDIAEQYSDDLITDSQWEYIVEQLDDDELIMSDISDKIAQMISEGEGV